MKKAKNRKRNINSQKGKYLENSKYFVPISFSFILVAMIFLFRDFIFSNRIFHSGDLIQAGFFFRSFFVEYFKSNLALPKWDPYIFSGLPFVDAFHGDIYYPFSKLVLVGPIFKMLSYNLIVHIYFSGIFTYFCARQLRLSKVAAIMSAIAYMFSPFLISLIAPFHDGKIFVSSLFPLTILFLDRGFEKRPFINFSIYGLIIGIIIITPHPQMAYFTLWANAFYTIYKLFVLYFRDRSLKKVAVIGFLPVYAVLIGLSSSAIQMYPGYVYTNEFSPRADAKKGWDWATSWSLHEEEAFSLLIPEFVGTSTTNAETYYWGKNPFKDNSETTGIVPLFLALIGLFLYRKKSSYFFGGLASFALIYALGANTFLFRLFYYLIPMVKSLRAPSMIMFLFAFSVAILAGMGIQSIMDKRIEISRRQKQIFKYIVFGMPGLMLFLALIFSLVGKTALRVWSSLFYNDASITMVQQGISKFDVAVMNLSAIQSGAWLGFLFAAVAALFVWLYARGKAGVSLLIIILLIPVVDSIRFNSRFISLFDYKPYLQSNAVVNHLKKDNTKFRVHDFTQNARLNLAYHQVELVTGYHGNQLKWYDQLLGGPSQKNVVNPRLLNLVGTKYLILPRNQRIPEGYFGPDTVREAMNFTEGMLIQNDNSFPRVFLVDSVRVFTDIEQIQTSVLRSDDNLRDVVYLEETPEIDINETISDLDSVWITSYSVDSVLVNVKNDRNKILVLTDNYYDSWNVYVDGKPARLLRAYSSFRAVAIPADTKEVLFKYESNRYKYSKIITLATLAYLLIVFGYFSATSLMRKFNIRE